MGLKDLIVTPIYLTLLTLLAYWIRPYVTNPQTRRYFMPALWVRFIGAIALGTIYQFYYGGGDTFNYWEHGSRWIYYAFQDDFFLGLKLLLEDGGIKPLDETYYYSSRIWYYRNSSSYVVVRITALFDLLTLHTYSASSLFFALFSFSGLWAMYSAVQKKYPYATKKMALAILFIPSVIFWGSGILKDTLTIGAVGWMTWSLVAVIEMKKRSWKEVVVLIISFYLIFGIKKYILICFVPMIAVWIFFVNVGNIRNKALKLLIVPLLLMMFGLAGFLALNQITKDDQKYSLDSIAERSRITAYDIRYGWGARNDGDGGYDIGLSDGTWQGLLRMMPAAITVSIFRPYIWEVRNPLMLLTALESLIITFLFLKVFFQKPGRIFGGDPFMRFCFYFTILFAFAVGASSFNFGTLMRYKIPFMPFLVLFLVNINSRFQSKKELKKG